MDWVGCAIVLALIGALVWVLLKQGNARTRIVEEAEAEAKESREKFQQKAEEAEAEAEQAMEYLESIRKIKESTKRLEALADFANRKGVDR